MSRASSVQLSRQLVLEEPMRVADGLGGFTQEWQALGTHWAQVTARTGRESGIAGGVTSRMGYKIVVRAAPWGAAKRPRPDQRFREGARVFRILAVTEHDAGGLYLACTAQEEVVA